jgi:hypothetical protein
MRKQTGLETQLPPCAVAATCLLMRAPQKSFLRWENTGKSMFPPSHQPYPQGTGRSITLNTGPCSQPHKMVFGVCQQGSWSAAAAAGAGCQVPCGNSGVCQVSSSALEKWLVTRMHVAQSTEWICVPHSGKIMIVLVFMGHNITSAGGSVIAVAL